MNNPQQHSLRDNVLKVIESGRIKMRPKWQFVTQTILFIIGIILVVFTMLFLASFIVFMLRQTGVWFVPGFGLQGFGVFLASLPWVLVVIAVIFIGLLEILIRRYSFIYGQPLMRSAFGVIALAVIGGIIIGFTSFHQNLFDRAENGQLPFAGPLYEQFGQPPQNVTVGKITQITDAGYQIQGPRGENFSVVVTPGTQLPPENNLKIGDLIVILGQRQQGNIQAIGIQKPGNLPPPPPFLQRPPPPGY
jgi:hypothetical protein